MSSYQKLYLNDRFFYALGIAVFLFLCAYEFEPLYLIASVFVCLIAVIGIIDFVLLFRKNLILAERKCATVFGLNDENQITLIVKSLSNFKLYTCLIDEVPYQFNKRDFKVDLTIPPKETTQIKHSLTPKTRGEYAFGDVQVFIRTKIGFVKKRETTPAHLSVAVYPSVSQMYKQELLAMQHPAFLQGGSKNKHLGSSYEFDQIKIYQPGDDTRHINWKASSSLNQVMVNNYEDERSQLIYSIIDKSRVMKMPFNSLTLLDYAINATLALSNIILKKQDKAGLILFSQKTGGILKAEKGPRHLKKLLYCLYKEQYDYSEADYENLYLTVRSTIPNRSLIFLYTNFESLYALERILPALKLINQRHLLVVVYFENEELKNFANEKTTDILDIYQKTIAKKSLMEKNQIHRELIRNGIHAIRCTPQQLSTTAINRYLELKMTGSI